MRLARIVPAILCMVAVQTPDLTPIPVPPPPADRSPGAFSEADWEVRFRHPLVDVRCVHPRMDGRAVALQRALRIHLREVAGRAQKTFEEYLEALEESEITSIPWDYSERWSIASETAEMVSLGCSGGYYSGGAHPNAFFRAKTLWLEGDQVSEPQLSDLFDPCTAWTIELSDRVLAELRAAEASRVLAGEIRFLDGDVQYPWVLTREGIAFLIAPYEIGCYAEGCFTPVIRYADIRHLLNPVGPARGLLR